MSQGGNVAVSLRCPSCRQLGTFEQVGIDMLLQPALVYTGKRRCPNPDCHAQMYVSIDGQSMKVEEAYPPELIDFDSSDVPTSVVAALEEAITCHANKCFFAAAIMVRKTLEEIAHDQHTTGSDLAKRIDSLGQKVGLPPEYIQGLHDLRFLGNDGAHFELKHYDQVGPEEVTLGVGIVKEVLQRVYQYTSLVRQLQARKKP
jgi:hypothetical protein